MLRSVLSISLILLTSCVCVSLANTNTISQPLPPTASDQSQTINKEEPINGHLYEFSYTLDFARELGFGSIVELLEKEQYVKAMRELRIKTSSGFSWNKEAISGYQYGFFAEALKGICLEKTVEVVKAYRAYQNARSYCNEKKVSTLVKPISAPKLEVYAGIGRMCNAAGRWMDSLTYLDAARMEAAEYPSIAAAADRAMIYRALHIGDYEEAVFMYNDLQQITKLKKQEYYDYARILFDMWNNRKGFAVILEGILRYGIDNDLGFEDPLVTLYLTMSLRAEENEVKEMYDLLGYAIETARAEKGDEEYLTKLLQARKYFCMAYDYLTPEQDLAKLKARIDTIKHSEIVVTNRVVPEWKSMRTGDTNTVAGVHADQPGGDERIYTAVEDRITEADLAYRVGNRELAYEMYTKLLKSIKGTDAYNRAYDGTTCGIAVTLPLLTEMLEKQGTTLWTNIAYDGSYRTEEYKARTYLKLNMPLEEQIEPLLPAYNTIYVDWLHKRCTILNARKEIPIRELENVIHNRNGLVDMFVALVKKCAKAGDIKTGYKAIWKRSVENLYYHGIYNELHYWKIIPDLRDEEFETIFRLQRIKHILKFVGTDKEYHVMDWNIAFEREQKIRESGKKVEFYLLNVQMVDLTHPKYAELQMENMTNIKSTNTWVTKMLAVLPGYIYDYPAARSIPLIQNTRNWLKICDQRWVRSGYKLVIRSRYHYYKANGIEMLAPEHFEQADAFLAELEQKAQAETENEK